MSEPQESSEPAARSFIGVRRTELAQERTYLAWMRSALAAFAVSLATGKLIPALTNVRHWPYQLLGAGFGILGLLMGGYGLWRQNEVSKAIAAGTFAEVDRRMVALLTGIILVLGVFVLAVLV